MAKDRAVHPHIHRDPKICAGSPVVRGTRVRVIDVALEYERLGRSADEIVAAHPQLDLAKVHDALSYYFEHKHELDQRLQRNLADLARLRAHYPQKLNAALAIT